MGISLQLQPRDGGWITIGTQQDGGYGIHPEGISYDGDLAEYGCLAATARLRLNPKWPRTILERATPVCILDGSEPVWSGRIVATPSTYSDDSDVVLEMQGWGQHLKDDCTNQFWVIDDLGQWQDVRNHATNVFSVRTTGYNVIAGGGQITMSVPLGNTAPNGSAASVYLDAGEGNTIERLVVTYTGGGAANLALTAHSCATPGGAAVSSSTLDATPIATSSTTASCTFGSPQRYARLNLLSSAIITGSDTAYVALSSILAFADDADESGNASALYASTVITETLDALCPSISTRRDQIGATSYAIPHFPQQRRWAYASELIDEANQYHGRMVRLTPAPVPVFQYAALPTDYSYVVGAGEYTLQQPAADDLRSVYSRIISEYTDAAGNEGYASATEPTTSRHNTSSTQPTNPSLATDTTGWFEVSRTTADYYTAPASAQSGGFLPCACQIPGLKRGKRYLIDFAAKAETTGHTISVHGGQSMSGDYVIDSITAGTDITLTTSWQLFTVEIMLMDEPLAGREPSIIFFTDTGYVTQFDDVCVREYNGNVIDQRGFRRTALKPAGTSTAATAGVLAQLELDNAQYPPFKGTLAITGRVRTKGGGSLPASHLPSRVGDALLIEDMRDPITGALGRQGIIHRARYDTQSMVAEVEIDNARTFIQQLRNRLAAIR